MTQPSFVPVVEADQVRRAYQLHVPATWTASRPSEVTGTRAAAGFVPGHPRSRPGVRPEAGPPVRGPSRAAPRRAAEDAVVGCTAVAMRRAALFGRAPVVHDLTHAFTLWGFLPGAPDDLRVARAPLFRAAAHHYRVQRSIADCVADTTLRPRPNRWPRSSGRGGRSWHFPPATDGTSAPACGCRACRRATISRAPTDRTGAGRAVGPRLGGGVVGRPYGGDRKLRPGPASRADGPGVSGGGARFFGRGPGEGPDHGGDPGRGADEVRGAAGVPGTGGRRGPDGARRPRSGRSRRPRGGCRPRPA